MIDLKTKRILVTGGAGFLGRHICQQLCDRGCEYVGIVKPKRNIYWRSPYRPGIYVVRSQHHDLSQPDVVKRLISELKPDIIIHAAAICGGIGANQSAPGTFYYKNAMMGTNIIDQSMRYDVEKLVIIGTVCAYPKYTKTPFKESDLWAGYPEETNAPYGLAKKMMLVQAQAYKEEFGLNSIYLLPINLYGPHDNFNLHSSHVIPALIRKCVEAKEKNIESVEVWGDGTPTREFLYVEDAADGIICATERYEELYPVNLGCGKNISINDLAMKIRDAVGYKGNIIFDSTKPNGQPDRLLDVSLAKEKFNFSAKTDFDEGLEKTIRWYETEGRYES